MKNTNMKSATNFFQKSATDRMTFYICRRETAQG